MTNEIENKTYKRTIWKNDETHLNASNMNNIEYGVDYAVNTSNKNSRDIEDHNKKIEILNGTEETEGSVKKTVKDAKKEVIGDYSESFTGNKHETIASTVEDFQSQVISLNDEIDDVIGEYSIDYEGEKLRSLASTVEHFQSEVGQLRANDGIIQGNINLHADDKNNPHQITASQLNVYTKDETFTKNEVKNEIALSGGGSGTVNVDTTLIIPMVKDGEFPYEIELVNPSNILPQNIFITVKFKDDIEDISINGVIGAYDSNLNIIANYPVSKEGTYQLTIKNVLPYKIIYNHFYLNNKNVDDWVEYLDITVSYLTEGGVEKIFDYIDITALTKLDTLISSGTTDPDETIKSQYYFKYSE